MKVIGKSTGGKLICEVGSDEICRVFNHYSHYSCEDEVLLRSMEVGMEIDLAKGYSFLRDIRDACCRMQDAVKSFGAAQNTLLAFSELIAKNQVTPEEHKE